MQIIYEKKQVIGCKFVSTLKIWLNAICEATRYFNAQEKKQKRL